MNGKSGLFLKFIVFLTFIFSLLFVPLNSADYCGDANKDGSIDILDVVSIINYKYKDGPAPKPLEICDVDQSGEINILDAVYIINFKYKDGPLPDCLLFECASNQSDCLSREYGTYRIEPNGTMSLVADGYDLHVYHNDAYYNCCLDYNTSYSIMGNGINIFEFDSGLPCDCICYFNLETVIEDLTPGQYYVTLFDIPGDTVGFGSIEMTPYPELTDYSSSGCISASREDIDYSFNNGTLIMTHHAYLNCAADILIEFSQSRDTLRFYEINVSDYGAFCECYFDLSATVSDLFPGSYVAEIYQKHYTNTENGTLIDRREITLE